MRCLLPILAALLLLPSVRADEPPKIKFNEVKEVAAAHKHLAIAAVLTYALAYTCELGLSLAAYYGKEAGR